MVIFRGKLGLGESINKTRWSISGAYSAKTDTNTPRSSLRTWTLADGMECESLGPVLQPSRSLDMCKRELRLPLLHFFYRYEAPLPRS